MLTASLDGTARVWDAGSGVELRRLAGHPAAVRAAAYRPDGALVVTGSAAGQRALAVWRTVEDSFASGKFNFTGSRPCQVALRHMLSVGPSTRQTMR